MVDNLGKSMEFKAYLEEATGKTAVMAFGRFNPPTIGHEKLIHKVAEVAKEHNGEAHIIASHSEGKAKDPLPQHEKLGYLKKIAPEGVHVSGSSKEHPTFLHSAAKLYNQGHKHLVVVAGDDRAKAISQYIHQYNGVESKHGHYNFKSIKVVSSGARDPDSEGVEGMSGTKMREHARSGNMKAFKSGLPKALHPHAEEIANHIRNVKEDYENPYRFDDGTTIGTDYMKKLTPGETRKPIKEFKEYNKIPFLFLNDQQKKEMFGEEVVEEASQSKQLEFDGIETKHFDECPDAYKLFKGMIDTIRAGKHIGEITGHETPTPVSKAVAQVKAGIALKPQNLRYMQFKQYVG